MRNKIIFTGVILLVLITAFGTALAADLSGEEIMKKVYNRETGDSRTANLKMILVNKQGSKRIREIKQFEKDFGEVDKKIMFFISPADVRNTSFMNWSYDSEQSDDQWIFLPALNKVKRISSENKSDYFMGSDFTYDDLGDRTLAEDEHKLIGEDTIHDKEVYVVENIPVAEDDLYSRTVTYVWKDKWIGLKKEFYDREGELLKVLTVNEVKEISGILTIVDSEMHNLQNEHRTILKNSEVEYNTSIDANLFSERMMKRGIQ
ncbi:MULTISPECIES: outer membrane lipoprotein-sorting protein [Halanaerobium]|jgi:hypothetical protein|uniref:Outer membrane lipoprotein-sorting protein n=1 Tax=Halanaerobium kushneri TaxID=56779 RepID=A0A1N6TJH0_9FIRM|nr:MULTISPECIES: outer membrane lipoprotein-sorting protein [Halanaerobium]RCW56234.1 outer membrane lipoprotein-sorting protein [Halanaerobium sp. ST460_2HS_T2]SIQ53256.1 outer membrane lipoprotein-sorting protein [Halanaerobium kushneri]